MVELQRGIYRSVAIRLWAPVEKILEFEEEVKKGRLPLTAQVIFDDGRVGYFLLTEAGFPYLAYALFSDDKPRDEGEKALYRHRVITADIHDVLKEKFPYRYYDFSYNWERVRLNAPKEVLDEMQRFIEWAEKLTLEDVEVMLDKLVKLEEQQRVEPEIIYNSPEWCLRNLRIIAALLRWFIDERTREDVVLVVGVCRRIGEPGVD
ncbi:MAG: hypothetical protein QXU69_07665 [Thermofilaceae archaeon]